MTLGLDYASVDANNRPDFAKARAAGARFAYIRGYQQLVSRDLPDPHYARDAEDARKAGLVVGAYLFPSYYVRAVSPREQVARFKKATASAGIIPGKDFPPALDVEVKNCDWKATGRSKAELITVTEQFVRELQHAFGCNPAIYTSYHQWWGLGYPTPNWVVECPLWVKTAYQLQQGSKYSDKVSPLEPHFGYDRGNDPRNNRRVPDAWAKSGWFVQQYLGDIKGFPGYNRTVDINRFNVSREGAQGAHVQWFQRKLKIVSDGDFGPKTDRAIRDFQRRKALLVDGVVGPKTFAALCWE